MATDRDNELLDALVSAANGLLQQPENAVGVNEAEGLVKADLWLATRIENEAGRQTAIDTLQRVSNHHRAYWVELMDQEPQVLLYSQLPPAAAMENTVAAGDAEQSTSAKSSLLEVIGSSEAFTLMQRAVIKSAEETALLGPQKDVKVDGAVLLPDRAKKPLRAGV